MPKGSSVPNPKFVTKFPSGASRLASLLLAHIYAICSLVAPRDPGAAPGTLATNFGSGTLALELIRIPPQGGSADQHDQDQGIGDEPGA